METELFPSRLAPLFLGRVSAEAGPAASAELAQRFGLAADAEAQPMIELPLPALRAFAEACAERCKDPWLGLTVGASLSRGTFGLAELTMRAAPTLRAAIGNLLRFSTLFNARLELSLDEHGDQAALVVGITGEPLCMGRELNECSLAAMLAPARLAAAGPLQLRAVRFAHPAPEDLAPLQAFFGTRALEFDRGWNALVLDRALLDERVTSADPVLGSLLEGPVATAAEQTPPRTDLLKRVRRQIELGLRNRAADIEHVSHALRIGSRTLQRRLGALGVTFNDVLDDVRAQLARSYVESGVELSEIAWRLGYAQPRAFQRAYKRWTGQTPGAHRRARASA